MLEKAKRIYFINIEKTKKKQIQNQNDCRRSCSLIWSLSVNNEKIEVCKTFFLKTLDISDTMVYTTLNKTLVRGSLSQKGGVNHFLDRMKSQRKKMKSGSILLTDF